MSALDRVRGALAAGRGASNAGPIGLDLGTRALHLMQLERAAGGPRIRAAVSLGYPAQRQALLDDPAALKAFLRGALQRRPFRDRRVVCAMPPEDLKLMVLDYRLEESGSEPETILGLVEERMGTPTDELVVDYLPIRILTEKSGGRSALVAVATRSAVLKQLERFRRAGLEVVALEIAPVAVRRLVSHVVGRATDGNALVIYCGRERSHLTVLWGRRLILYREVEFGESQALEALGKALDMDAAAATALLHQYGVHPPGAGDPASADPAESLEIAETIMEILKPAFYGLAEHVDKAIVYTASKSRGASPERVHLLGEAARWPRADRLLESLLSIPVRCVDPLSHFAAASTALVPGELDGGAGLALVAGLALRGMDEDE